MKTEQESNSYRIALIKAILPKLEALKDHELSTGFCKVGYENMIRSLNNDLKVTQSEAIPTTNIKHVCTKCGSDNIHWDATAAWNIEKQEFELASTQDQAYCNDCDSECETDLRLILTPE